MKNSSQKNNTGKNNKDYKKNSDFGYHKKNTNRLEKKEPFSKNSSKKKNVENLNKKDKNNTFSSLKRRNPKFKSDKEFSKKNSDNHQEFTTKSLVNRMFTPYPIVKISLSSELLIIIRIFIRKFTIRFKSWSPIRR